LSVAPIIAANSGSPPTAKVLNGNYYGAHSPTYGQYMFLGTPTPCHQLGIFGCGKQQAQPLNTT
jgi:hypothetical protein